MSNFQVVNQDGQFKLVQTIVQEEALDLETIYTKLIDLERRKKMLQNEIVNLDTEITKYEKILSDIRTQSYYNEE